MSDRTRTETVVLIHGLWMHGVVMQLLSRRLRNRHGFAVASFSYRSVMRGAEVNTGRLVEFLRRIDTPSVHLVGHSLGGVLAVKALERWSPAPPGRVVCLGSPLTGSRAARRLLNYPGGELLIGRTLQEAVVEHPLQTYAGSREVGVIAGDLGVGAGRMLGMRGGSSDGMVAVEETRLSGVKDHLTLHVAHTWMLVARDVADQTAFFLRQGMFRRA